MIKKHFVPKQLDRFQFSFYQITALKGEHKTEIGQSQNKFTNVKKGAVSKL